MLCLRRTYQKSLFICLVTVFAAGLVASAQVGVQPALPADARPLAYDVVSVKANRSGKYDMSYHILPDGFEATNVTLKSLMQTAYAIRGDLMSGGPAWLDSTKFDLKAKLAGRSEDEIKQLGGQFQPLLQGALEDRFQLKVHREVKQLPVFDLVIANGGAKFKEETQEEGDALDKKPGGLARGSAIWSNGVTTQCIGSIENLIGTLADTLHRTVIDKTSLAGKYDLILKWADEDRQQKDDGSAESSVPNVFTALQEQLGLKLQPSKGPVETLIVDHVELPSEN